MLHVALILCWMNSLETPSTSNPLWERRAQSSSAMFIASTNRQGGAPRGQVTKNRSLNGLLCVLPSNCSLPFSKCSINLESLAVHCFFNCSFYFIDKYFCVVVKKHDSHFRPVGAIQCHIVPTVSHSSYTKRHYMHRSGIKHILL